MNFQRFAAVTLSSSLIFTSLGPSLLVSPQAVAETAPEQLVAQQVAVLSSGQFVTVEQEKMTTGQVRIISENGKRYLELDNQFTTAEGPDVELLLHKKSKVGVKLSENENKNEYITLARLKSFQGAQRYEIPADVDLDVFKSVVIWCRKFNVTFAYSSL
ncbi:MAG: DM13 domain-containing protein [Microcystaceae cyanobacterium]